MLAFHDGPGARRATNGRKTFAVQGIRGDAVGVHVRVELRVRPVDERVEFDQAGHAVPFKTGEGRPVVALRGTKSRDPHGGSLKGALQGINFPDAAAGFSRFDALENGRHALLVDELL